MSRYIYFILIFTTSICLSCKDSGVKDQDLSEENSMHDTESIDSLLSERFNYLANYPVDSLSFPRSFNSEEKKIKKVPSKDWTSGFFAGNLWQLYDLTGESRFRESALKWTRFIEKEKFNGGTHDMGFKVYDSFGLGMQMDGEDDFEEIIMKSAQTLSTRFNENVQSIRSWDFRRDQWEFPVIIDNMMNLELLFEATRLSRDSSYHKMAVTHANTTLKIIFGQITARIMWWFMTQLMVK